MDRLSIALDSFRCYRDDDIETFLRQKALNFLDRGWCSIYLLVDEELFDKGSINILGYFTLSHKSLIPEGASKSTIKKASGMSGSESIHFVLIGQLGRYLERKPDGSIIAGISGKELLDRAFEVIHAASELIPCRCVLVECSDNKKVHQFYLDNRFSKFQHDGEHLQFYKRI